MGQGSDDEIAQEHAGKPGWAMSSGEHKRAQRAAEGLPQSPRVFRWILLVAIIAAAAYYFYQRSSDEPETLQVEAPTPVMQVNTSEMAILEPQTLRRNVKVSGSLEPIRRSHLSSQVSGQVEDVRVQAGDSVKAGDILVQVDIETLELELAQMESNAAASRAQLDLAEMQLARIEKLIDRGIATASSLEEAESNVRGLRASLGALREQVSGAELRLRNATVYAPFDGIISARDVDPGQYVGVGAALITVVDLKSVEMQANAPVGSGAMLRRDQNVDVKVDGIPDRSFVGTVMRINPVAEPGTRTVPVYVIIENDDSTLLGGMFATGHITVDERHDALAVPTVALRESEDGLKVLAITGDQLTAHPVEVGQIWAGGLMEITAGLTVGQKIITAPLSELSEGDAVEIFED